MNRIDKINRSKIKIIKINYKNYLRITININIFNRIELCMYKITNSIAMINDVEASHVSRDEKDLNFSKP